jgi:hypothetical protein
LILLSVGVSLILGVSACGNNESTTPAPSSSSSSPPSGANTTAPAKPSGLTFSVKTGAVTGYLDSAHVEGADVTLSGWAASSDLAHVASNVSGVVGRKTVAEAVPALERPDVVESYGKPALKQSGFELHVPLSSLKCSAAAGGLTVFGSLNGVGSPLSFVENTEQVLSGAC